jgi:hypothetical protein
MVCPRVLALERLVIEEFQLLTGESCINGCFDIYNIIYIYILSRSAYHIIIHYRRISEHQK